MTFSSLEAVNDFAHAFTLRHPDIDVAVDRAEALRRLNDWHHDVLQSSLGFASTSLVTAEQVHGNRVAVIESLPHEPEPATDGLICAKPGLALGIYVADCCAIFLVDPVTKAFGVLHSGKKGTEQNILGNAIALMGARFGTDPANLIVQLSPCIRPPAYEVDFAATIREQASGSGVMLPNIHDDGICTSSDREKFYSYRMEKGKTGRMLAILGRSR